KLARDAGCLALLLSAGAGFGIGFAILASEATALLVITDLWEQLKLPTPRIPDLVMNIIGPIIVLLAVGIPAVAGLLVRDIVLQNMMVQRARKATCPACHFSLRGLPVEAGIVRCPECGLCTVLSSIGLLERDLGSFDTQPINPTPPPSRSEPSA